MIMSNDGLYPLWQETMTPSSSVFMGDNWRLSHCGIRVDVLHRFGSKSTHFQRKVAAGYEYVSMPEQHMCPCRVSLIRSWAAKIFSFPLLLLQRLVRVTEVMLAEGQLGHLFFCLLAASSREMWIKRPVESLNPQQPAPMEILHLSEM